MIEAITATAEQAVLILSAIGAAAVAVGAAVVLIERVAQAWFWLRKVL